MVVKVTTPLDLYVDNMGVILNATNPGSSLNKKIVALAYHYVREHVVNHVVRVNKIDTKENYADMLTKPLANTAHNDFVYEIMRN